MKALSSLIKSYLEIGEYEKKLSFDTIKAYRIDLRQFCEFTKGKIADTEMLGQYIKHLNQHFAPPIRKTKISKCSSVLPRNGNLRLNRSEPI